MPEAPRPKNDKARVLELQKFCVLDTDPEERFDTITQIAAEVTNSPVALISLVDEGRQWFKSKIGLDVSETARELAFCGYVTYDKKPFIVEDATKNKRVQDNALVTGDPHIRFYAGVPIITKDNYVIGSLCVIDFEPRTISDSQLKILELLSKQISSQLEFNLTIDDLEKKQSELLEAKHKLEAASKSKSIFLASMSHELRTPLNSIIGFTKRLIKKLKSNTSDKDFDALKTVERNAEQLLEMINEIIDLSRLEAGIVKVKRNNFDVGFLVQGVAKTTQAAAEARGLEFTCTVPDKPVLVKADRTKVMQILKNLTDNALRFTDEGSIHISLEVEVDNFFTVRVIDTGTGISPENMGQLFKKFSQFEKDEAKRRGGTGIGLSISHEYVRLHGGEMKATSELGKGSEFCVRLPVGMPHSIERPETENMTQGDRYGA